MRGYHRPVRLLCIHHEPTSDGGSLLAPARAGGWAIEHWHAHSGGPSEAFDNARYDVSQALQRVGFAPQNLRQFSVRPERYKVPAHTAVRINAARDAGNRVIAVGTTVVRALETVAGPDGTVRPGAGWTSLTVTPERGVRAVDGLLTGWHEPEASHLLMLEAVAGRPLLEASYAASLREGYLWHEFGDLHLIIP